MSKPKIIANLGDVNPFEYGGCFVLDNGKAVKFSGLDELDVHVVYSFDTPRCYRVGGARLIDGSVQFKGLTTNPDYEPHQCFEHRVANLRAVARCNGMEMKGLIDLLCSESVIDRAQGYSMLCDYDGSCCGEYPETVSEEEMKSRWESPWNEFESSQSSL